MQHLQKFCPLHIMWVNKHRDKNRDTYCISVFWGGGVFSLKHTGIHTNTSLNLVPSRVVTGSSRAHMQTHKKTSHRACNTFPPDRFLILNH